MSIDLVKQLREKTQASLADCRKALEEAGGDIEEAAKLLRTRGQAIAAQKAGREAAQGTIAAYVHGNGAIAVLVEVRCETDFVARSPQFQEFAHNIALHIAASNPKYLAKDNIPQEIVDDEKRLIIQEFSKSGKSAQVIEKIAEGKISALAREIALLEQPFVKNPDQTIAETIAEAIGKFGEKIEIGQFVRFAIGE